MSLSNEYHPNETFDSHLYPHTQVVRLGNEILTMNDITLSSALNAGSEWSNSSTTFKDTKHNSSIGYNASKIGIGVTEYLNDPWKQKPDFFEPTANVPNHLDNFDNGEGRRLVFANPVSKNSSIISNATEVASSGLTVTNAPGSTAVTNTLSVKSSEEKQNPYEFVTEQQLAPSDAVGFSAKVSEKTELEITEPVLKPKAVSSIPHSLRTRKSQNTFRPNYGKSINVESSKSPGPTTVMATSRRSLNTGDRYIGTTVASYANTSVAITRATTVMPEQGDELLDTIRTQPDFNGRALKKTHESEQKNSSTQLFVVQFLPQKLVSFFEQAERYARMAFLPFIAPQESSKSTGVGSRRIRTFTTSRWTSAPHSEANEKYDMETEESRNIAVAIAMPPRTTSTASFPYAYHVQKQQLWQPISRYLDSDRKYIPLAATGSRIVFPDERNTQERLQPSENGSR